MTGVMKDAETMWTSQNIEWTSMEKKIGLAEMVRIGVICMMKTHVFQWDGRWFLQKNGGPIGLRATCAVARVIMLWWDGQLLAKMKENNLKIEAGARYMDDVRLFLESIREGWSLMEDGLYFCEEWKREDEENDESPTQRTGGELRKIMNSIIYFLRLTIEIQDDFPDCKLPAGARMSAGLF